MDSDFSVSSEDEVGPSSRRTKKKNKTGRVRDVMKTLRATTHELGPDCQCNRFHCFTSICEPERRRIIREFNDLGDTNAQNAYLAGLITVLPVMRRRPRKNEDEARINTASFSYRVRISENGKMRDLTVCIKAFIFLHGITDRRVRYVRDSLVSDGRSPTDKHGKHEVRPHKLSDETKGKAIDFIKSLKGPKSHYSLNDSGKVYLPDTLNISKLHRMYIEQNPDHKMQYESFRCIFENNFNISFGYPRKDTCSTCDTLKADIFSLTEKSKSNLDGPTREKAQKELNIKLREKELHLRRSERFYQLKRCYRKRSMKSKTMEAITMDYQKNLPTPNITTNDVYYKRQLNFISFNIHVLSSSQAIFYTYDESIARKGADDVCSMMYHFFCHVLPMEVRELALFCDSCSGQNKNFTVIRFLHYIVMQEKRFETVKVIFPIRGHSYLECDRNMSLINQKTYTETPDDWREEFKNCRVKPNPFQVIDCGQNFDFLKWTDFLSPLYTAKCPFPTRPVRMLKIENENPSKIFHKAVFTGMYQQSPLFSKKSTKTTSRKRKSNSEVMLTKLHPGQIPIKKAKWDDLQALTSFLVRPEAKDFYRRLTYINQPEESEDEYVDNPPINA